MCGFAGVVGNFVERKDLYIKSDNLNHRGPDEKSSYIDVNVHIDFFRLSIIDHKGGSQPKISEDEKYILFFNGEIYNFKDIKKDLENENIVINTESEAEVLLQAFIKWGVSAIKKLNGMFSICFIDKNNQNIKLIRDQFGIKPIYYKINKENIVFSSEQKAIKNKNKINENSLSDYLNFQFYLSNETLIEDLYEVSPGTYVEIDLSTLKIKEERYFYLNFANDVAEYSTIDDLEQALNDSVKRQINADVKVGAHLSGGIDSSLISAITSKYLKNLPAYHGYFPKADPKYSELDFAIEVSKVNDIELIKVPIVKNDFIENFKEIIYFLDNPIVGPGVFPQYMVNKVASKDVKVLLGGQGGDEIFAGYARYLINYLEQAIYGAIKGTQNDQHLVITDNLSNSMKALKGYESLIQKMWAKDLFKGTDIRYYHLLFRDLNFELIDKSLVDKIEFSKQKFLSSFSDINEKSLINKMLYFDTKFILPGLLQVEDRVSMAHSLESRVPYLDQDVFETAARLDPKIKFQSGILKNPLKIIAKKYLPEKVSNREDKMGFPVPLDEWIKENDFLNFIISIIEDSKINDFSILDLREIINKVNKDRIFDRSLWGIICLCEWFNNYEIE